jgi:hypothetical protein
MATTTNYGWTTPDDTALVKDGAAAIRTLGSSVDTTTKALNPSTTLGDIEYRSSTANTNTRLPIGTTGQVLSVVGGVPAWAAVGGGGKVLQVVQATTTTQVQVSSTTYTDTTLTASITPSSASSKVLVLVSQSFQADSTASGVKYILVKHKLIRGSTDIFIPLGTAGFGVNIDTSATHDEYQNIGVIAYSYLDSPATTSSTTYKTQGAMTAATNRTVYFQNSQSSETSSIILLEIGA